MSTHKPYKLTFIRGYEVGGVSPLPHYYEEIYGHITGIAAVGPRGDNNYFWYSKNDNGAAYYEVNEQKLSALSTFDFLSNSDNVKNYFKQIQDIIVEASEWVARIAKLDLENLSIEDIGQYYIKTMNLDARIFSLYLISQPYRLQLFEDRVRDALVKRVAASRVDFYMAKLAASEQLTHNAIEEREWILLLQDAHASIPGKLTPKKLGLHPDLEKAVLSHYDRHKLLKLGDGSWVFDVEKEKSRFIADFNRPIEPFIQRLGAINVFSEKTLAERRRLEHELKLDVETIDTLNFLAKMSHVRYSLRVEGFIPTIFCSVQLADVYSAKLGLEKPGDLPYLTPEELECTVTHGSLTAVTQEEITERRGKHNEYLILLEDGSVSYFYNTEAGDMFKKLVPPIDHTKTSVISGVSAEQGRVKGRVTVYKWGDDVDTAIKSVRKYPILVAGQTRPAMMPIIRLAKGIITDEGGVTSHAAIVARELQIPTVINTENATKVLKTGDMVELDATNGVVRKKL